MRPKQQQQKHISLLSKFQRHGSEIGSDLDKWKGGRFIETRQSNRQSAPGDLCWIIGIPADGEEDRFVPLLDQWPSVPWRSLPRLSSPLWFHRWNRAEDVSSRRLELSVSSAHPSLLDSSTSCLLISWVKMSWRCSWAVTAQVINWTVPFGFVWGVD